MTTTPSEILETLELTVSKRSRIVNFEHSELGTLEVLVTGYENAQGKGFDSFNVYYGSYNITSDLSDEDRLRLIKQLNVEVTRANG
jgi:hypothetical protein